jgi:predicted ATP-grasp superfamily ATP-dependent carboligase
METVVITGADNTTGLSTVRALAGLDLELIGLYRKDTPACQSKYWNKLIRVDEHEETIDALVRIAGSLNKKATLFVTQDNIVKQISDNREELSKYYNFRLPSKEIVDIFIDKSNFHKWALKNNLTVPESYICQSHEELAKVLNAIEFPVVIKPYEKSARWDYYSPFDKVYKLDVKKEIENISFDLFEASAKVVVQQWIKGEDNNIYFCLVCYDGKSKCMAAVTGRKLLQWPVFCGNTAAAVSVDNKSIQNMTAHIFDTVGYQGLGSMEFKYNDIDGKYYVIEPTIGRNDLQSGLSVACGVNLTAMSLAELQGNSYKAGMQKQARWLGEIGTSAALRYHYKHNSLNFKDVLNLFSLNMVFEYFSIKDILPSMGMFKKTIKNKTVKWKNHTIDLFEKLNRKIKRIVSLLVKHKYQELFYVIAQKVPFQFLGYTNFYFIKCDKLNAGHMKRALHTEYKIYLEKFTPQLLDRVERELPQDLSTVHYRIIGREDRTNVIVIEHKGKIVANMFLLLDNYVPSPSNINLHFADRKVVTCYGVYLQSKYRLQGLHVHLLKKAYEFSATHSDSSLYGEVHFMNKNSILSHYKIGFNVYRNVHMFIFFGKKFSINGKNKFWCVR